MSDTNNQNSCSQRPCQSKTHDHPRSNGPDEVNSELRGRPVLYAGVVWIGILRRFLIPRTCGSQFAALVEPEAMPRSQDPPEAVSVNHVPAADPATHSLVQTHPHAAALLAHKPPEQDLEQRRLEMLKNSNNNLLHPPLAALVSQVHEASLAAAEHALQLTEDISTLVRNSRNTTTAIVSQIHEASLAAAEHALQLTEDINTLVRNFRENSSETLAVLRAEEGAVYRCGVVAAAGLTGFLAGLPRGRTTRLVYTLTGATTAAVVCYPAEARVYNHRALVELRRWLDYSLAALMQRQDPQKLLEDEDWEQAQNQQLNFHSLPLNSNIAPSEDTHHEDNDDSESCIFPGERSDEDVSAPRDPAEYHYSSAPPMPPGPAGPTYRPDRKLLSQCQPGDVTVGPPLQNSAPYPLDVPSSSKRTTSFSSSDQSGMQQNPPSHSLPTASSQENIGQSSVSHGSHPNSRRDHQNPKLQNLDKKILGGTRNVHPGTASEPNSNPLEINKHILGRGDDVPSQQYPLNKKLSKYYVRKPEETTATTETGYDDLYSKRE